MRRASDAPARYARRNSLSACGRIASNDAPISRMAAPTAILFPVFKYISPTPSTGVAVSRCALNWLFNALATGRLWHATNSGSGVQRTSRLNAAPMRFLSTLFWALVAAIAALFSWVNWTPVGLRLWDTLGAGHPVAAAAADRVPARLPSDLAGDARAGVVVPATPGGARSPAGVGGESSQPRPKRMLPSDESDLRRHRHAGPRLGRWFSRARSANMPAG